MIREFAPAKVNLDLHITARRDDGYHLLDSLVVFAELGDVLDFEPADRFTLEITGPFGADLSGDDNIIERAYVALSGLLGREQGSGAKGAKVTLHKNLPVASGIGGGSADAAATLRGLQRLWGTKAGHSALMALAKDLGADVPVCLNGRPVIMQGIGEILTDAPLLPEGWLVLVNPLVGVSTPQVFKKLTPPFAEVKPWQGPVSSLAALVEALKLRRNDLEHPATQIAPVVSQVLDALRQSPNCLLARMSGSGATCFGIFATQTQAHSAATIIKSVKKQWWVESAKIRA